MVTRLILFLRPGHLSDIRQQDRVAIGPFLHIAARRGLHLEAKEVRRVAFVEDDEDLRQHTLSVRHLQLDHFVDLPFEEVLLILGHDLTGWRSGARKFTVDRRTTSLRWL